MGIAKREIKNIAVELEIVIFTVFQVKFSELLTDIQFTEIPATLPKALIFGVDYST